MHICTECEYFGDEVVPGAPIEYECPECGAELEHGEP